MKLAKPSLQRTGRLIRAVLAASFLVAGLAPARAQQALSQGATKVASVEGITEYRLQNGLRVLLFPDPTKSSITVNVTYMVGSRHEGYGETGMAHLLEHMLFMDTQKYKDIKKELADRGASPNGSTSFDRTNYFETFQASDDNLKWALSMEADRMVNSSIDPKKLETEMTVVRNEFESGENNPGSVLFKRVLAAMYQWHNYGKVPIGARSDIERVPNDRLKAFYREYYQPDNALLVVAGKIDEPATLKMVADAFGPIPKPTRILKKTYTVEPEQDGERNVTLRRVGTLQGMLIGYHIPPGSHEEFPAVDLAAEILGDVPSGRLHKALVETKKASSASMGTFQLREPGVAFVDVDVRTEGNLDEARQIALKVIDDVKTSKFTKEELERVRTKYLNGFQLFMNNSQAVAMNLSEWQGMGDWRLMFVHRDRMKKVTLEQAQAAAEKYFIASNRTVGIFIPQENPVRASVPEAEDVEALVKDYKGEAVVSQGEAFDPSPSNIDKRTIRGQMQGGLKLSFIDKKTRGEQVMARFRFRFGDLNALKNRDAAAVMAGSMLMRGTANRTRQQIKDEFDKLKAAVSIGGTIDGATISVTTTRANLPAVLDLAAEVIKGASFPESEFEQLRQQALASFEQNKTDPQALASVAMQRHMNPYSPEDPRYVDTIDESIGKVKSVTLDEVKAFYKEFYGASVGEVSIIGDFDSEAAQKQIGNLFNTWKTPKKYARIERPYQKIEAKQEVIKTPDKANAMWFAAIPFSLKDTDPDYPALMFGNYILGQAPLNNRLFARIRTKEGLSYGAGSQLQADALDDGGMFLAYAICAPENAPKVEATFRDEVSKVLNEGYSPAELEAAKKAWVQARNVARANDGQMVAKLGAYTYLGRTMQFDADIEKKVLALTPQQIQAVMKKYLDLTRMSLFRAGDFDKAKVTW